MATKTTKRTTTRKTTSRTKAGATATKTAAAKTPAAKAAAKTTAKAAPKTTAKAAPRTTAKAAPETTAKTTAAAAAPKTTVTAKAAPAKAKVAADAPKPEPMPTVVTDTPVVAGPMLRKKEFIERVVARAGLKKKDVKPAVEAALAELGEAIARGEEVNLPPFGKVKVNREKDLANAQVLICKLRRPKAMDVPPGGKDPLADAAE